MKTIYESIFDVDNNVDDVDVTVIEKFLSENYGPGFTISDRPNKDGKYEVTCQSGVVLQNRNIKSLTNNMFVFTEINGDFEIKNADQIEDLTGSPNIVRGCLAINQCKKLKSLKGISECVGKVYIDSCPRLKSIDYMPKTIYGMVDYHNSECSEYDDIYIESCPSLESMPAIKNYKKKLALRLFDCPAKSLKDIPDANVYNSWIYLN